MLVLLITGWRSLKNGRKRQLILLQVTQRCLGLSNRGLGRVTAGLNYFLSLQVLFCLSFLKLGYKFRFLKRRLGQALCRFRNRFLLHRSFLQKSSWQSVSWDFFLGEFIRNLHSITETNSLDSFDFSCVSTADSFFFFCKTIKRVSFSRLHFFKRSRKDMSLSLLMVVDIFFSYYKPAFQTNSRLAQPHFWSHRVSQKVQLFEMVLE
jgi:hypothetical protein